MGEINTLIHYDRRTRNNNRVYQHYPFAHQIENDLLSFYIIFNKKNNSFDYKLELLKEYSKKVYHNVSNEILLQRRDSFARYGYFKYKTKEEMCKLCNKNKAECRHHIVSLKYGGFKSSTKRAENIMLLCEPCHELIHPWL